MSSGSDKLVVRHILSNDEDRDDALHLVLLGELPPPSAPISVRVASFLAGVAQSPLSIDLLFGAYRGNRLESACLAIESPGRVAMVLLPSTAGADSRHAASDVAVRTLTRAAEARSIALLEILVDPESPQIARMLERTGFRRLTRLLYLRRSVKCEIHPQVSAPQLTWLTYAPTREDLFCDALDRTYVQSLDCTELTGLRPTADVLAGHRATGDHDPALWWLAVRDDRPVGVLLLSRLPSEASLEIVYIGVSPEVRGMGVADALLTRAAVAARHVGDTYLTLAVDERNTPARRMYERWAFARTHSRDAWIASPCS